MDCFLPLVWLHTEPPGPAEGLAVISGNPMPGEELGMWGSGMGMAIFFKLCSNNLYLLRSPLYSALNFSNTWWPSHLIHQSAQEGRGQSQTIRTSSQQAIQELTAGFPRVLKTLVYSDQIGRGGARLRRCIFLLSQGSNPNVFIKEGRGKGKGYEKVVDGRNRGDIPT